MAAGDQDPAIRSVDRQPGHGAADHPHRLECVATSSSLRHSAVSANTALMAAGLDLIAHLRTARGFAWCGAPLCKQLSGGRDRASDYRGLSAMAVLWKRSGPAGDLSPAGRL